MDNKQTIIDNNARIDALTKRLNNSTFADVRDTTATAGDVLVGKVFYGADGVKTTGTLDAGESGDIGSGNYYLKVIDYDGTILAEKRLNTGDTYTLPNAPSHDGLVFQEWSCSQEIVDGVITINSGDVMVGAVYTTASGFTEFDITLTKVTGLDVTLNMNGTKNWGDGTSDDLTTHTYTEYGDYTITCNGTEMTTSDNSGIFGQSSNPKNYYCTSVRFGTGVTSFSLSVLRYCVSLTTVVIPNSVTSIASNSFGSCYSLKYIVIPSNVIIGSSAFQSCYSLTTVVMPQVVKYIYDGAFQYCYSLKYIVIPQTSNNKINASSFSNCYSIIKHNFTQHTTIPALSSSSAFSGINQLCKIYVPDALYDKWIVASNWVTYADYIYKASEMEA